METREAVARASRRNVIAAIGAAPLMVPSARREIREQGFGHRPRFYRRSDFHAHGVRRFTHLEMKKRAAFLLGANHLAHALQRLWRIVEHERQIHAFMRAQRLAIKFANRRHPLFECASRQCASDGRCGHGVVSGSEQAQDDWT
jgi:hypothetical protein